MGGARVAGSIHGATLWGHIGHLFGPPSGITGPISSDQEIKAPFHEPPRNAVVLNENKLGATPYLLFLKKRKRISSSCRPRALFEKAPSWKKEPFPTEPFLTHSLDPAWLHSNTFLAAGSHRNEDEEATATNASPGVRKSCHLFALGV